MLKFILIGLMFGAHAFADDNSVNCHGSTFVQADFISGNCNGGYCYANSFGNSLSTSGNCDDSVQFSATAYTYGDYISGQCVFGNLNMHSMGSTVRWSGQCSNGKTFSGTSYIYGNYINGSCNENGYFSAVVPGSSVAVEGTCN